MAVKSEDRIQQECYRWFHNVFPDLRGLLFHVPNGGSRDGREAAKFKTMGVYAGVSDLIFLFNKKCHLIELKNEYGRQSKAQKDWQCSVQAQGFDYHICFTLEEFTKLIHKIIDENN